MMRRRIVAPSVACSCSQLRSASDAEAQAVSQLTSHVREGARQANAERNHTRVAATTSRQNIEDQSKLTLQRIHEELLREADPLGGIYHKDYYRDPAKGYAPQYAPRNFNQGGAVQYHTPTSEREAARTRARGEAVDHRIQKALYQAREQREVAREMTSAEYSDFSTRSEAISKALLHRYESKRSQHPGVAETFDRLAVPLSKVSYAPSHRDAIPESPQRGAEAGVSSPADAHESYAQQRKARGFTINQELMRNYHGLRAQEEFEYQTGQRMSRRPNIGYDMDRSKAMKDQSMHFMNPFSPLPVPSSAQEAQTSLRQNSVPTTEGVLWREMQRNTVLSDPKVGTDMAEHVLGVARLTKQQARASEEKSRNEALGFGRKSALVQEAGPDKRDIKLHQNDERILRAGHFMHNVYSSNEGPNVKFGNPYERNNTAHGVGHLLRSSFDWKRREHLVGQKKQDPTELATAHYGIPINQQLDTLVRTRRNARSERHDDYFTQYPTSDDMRLQTAYRDVEGFPLLSKSNKSEFLEWELFVRYRAHHQQRRQLALLHGLEPIANETVHERDDRRRRLDELCEKVPFSPEGLPVRAKEIAVDATTLRNHFGSYFLPTPRIVESVLSPEGGGHLDVVARDGDSREHLLSARYLNKLLVNDAFLARMRSSTKELANNIPEPTFPHALPPSTVAAFSDEEKEVYRRYINMRINEHNETTGRSLARRRWIKEAGKYGTLHQASQSPVDVLDLKDVESGSLVTVPQTQVKSATEASPMVRLEDREYVVDFSSKRTLVPIVVEFADGSRITMEQDDFHSRPLEVEDVDPNAMQSYGLDTTYHYNRGNYIETQDAIWESNAYAGEEGWTTALPTDGIRLGTVVKARRVITNPDGSQALTGDYQRAIVVQFQQQPFFNPNPKLLTVRFVSSGAVEQVALSNVLVWQLSWYGPDRLAPDETRRIAQSMKRYVDVSDPNNEKSSAPPHFLDQYRGAITEDPFRSVKQIVDLDGWNINDESRPENKRFISISHRRDYVTRHYVPKYTPWDWIISQEADAPLIAEQLPTETRPASYNFAPNRHWRWKARPTGYIQNHPDEVRDLFQYVDRVTPWKKAQRIRTLWEVRSHHPMPKFHRPELAMHRNHPGLLPTHMWETDKKTGKVRMLKDSVRDYQTLVPYPSWVQL